MAVKWTDDQQRVIDSRGGNLLVSAAAHEACMYRCASSDKAFCCKLMNSVDGEHTVDVLVNITVIVSTV